MCQFFSANSDGKGKVIFFKPEDIAKEMSKGNPKNYEWNSHTSIADYHGIKGLDEDKWNKWEYNPDTKELKADKLNTTDDSNKVKAVIEEYLKEKDIVWLRNLYNRNSGDCNSGCIIGHFSSTKQYFLFNKPCTEEEAQEVYDLELWEYFNLTEWIPQDKMTDEEKKLNPQHITLSGYLKTISYKDAWAKVPKERIDEIKKLKNFDKDVFKEITGLDV